jgi:tetratricopeptide (TPR) repeat protein
VVPFQKYDVAHWRVMSNERMLLKFCCGLLSLLIGSVLHGRTVAQTVGLTNPQEKPTVEQHLGKGYEALKQERYEDAEKEFRAALAMDPSLGMRAQFPLAVALFEQHKSTEARRELETVRQEVGDQPGISYYLGRLDLDERSYKGAVEELQKASAHPPFPDTAFYLGMAYLKQGSDENAEKWLKKAIEINPDDSRAEYQLAILYKKQGRQEEANQAFERSKQNKAKSDKLSQLKWECGQELDRNPTMPAPSCEQLYDPSDPDRLTSLGILYGQHGQLEKALKPLQRAVELMPQSPQMQYNLAYTYYQLKRYLEAKKELETAVQHWPDLFPLSALYGAVLWNLGDVQPAYLALQHAHQLNADDAKTAALFEQSLLQVAKSADDSQAIGYFQEAASVAPSDPEPHRRLAEIYQRTGKVEQAREEAQRAVELAKSSKK